MPPLTTEQKAAGREWRSKRQNALTKRNMNDTPDLFVLPVARVARHSCSKYGGSSRAIVLREVYERSPDRVLAFIWRQGRCAACGTTARSRDGRVVLAESRPPLTGAQVI